MSGPINGQRGAFLQPTQYGEDSNGFYTLFTWQGTRDECLANVPFIRDAGGVYDMKESPTGSACVLTARFPINFSTPETPIDTWELVGQEVEKDLLEADNAAVNSISDIEKQKIREALINPSTTSSPALTSPAAISLYVLMLNGLRAIRVSVPTLRHTQTVSNRWTIPAALTNVGRLISTSSLTGLEAIPSGLLFNLPNFSSSRAGTGFVYAWYKKYPTVRIAARQKAQIEQEWEYGLWPAPANIPLYGTVL